MELQNKTRRDFLKKSSLAIGAIYTGSAFRLNGIANSFSSQYATVPVSKLKKPVAIAMWDYSWILRHHRYGSFENWDRTLEGLAGRGYNAIRMDAMPQFVAADTNGNIQHNFRSVKTAEGPVPWGNDMTMTFNPREALLEFLPKCKEYGIKVGLATWFMRHGTEREGIFMEEGGLLRAWYETLTFLEQNDMLDNVIYVDLLNEYPNWHGYDWFLNEMNKRSDFNQFKLNNPDANVPGVDFNVERDQSSELKKAFYNEFINSLIIPLKEKFPQIDFFASLDSGMDLDSISLENFDALDYHLWFHHTGRLPGLDKIRSREPDSNYKEIYTHLLQYWDANKNSLVAWMDGRITKVSEVAEKNNICCGNTEGWGSIWWFDHTELDWNWIKESAEICIDLTKKHDNYKFICTSNFTHPQFVGMWEDIAWHKKITSKIKS